MVAQHYFLDEETAMQNIAVGCPEEGRSLGLLFLFFLSLSVVHLAL